MQRKKWIYILLYFTCNLAQGQVVNPKKWYIGYNIPYRDTSSPDTGIVYGQFGSTIINFNKSPIEYTKNIHTLSAASTYIFDDNDSLILYTNGSKVFNGRHRLIENADSLSFGSDWITSVYSGTYFAEYDIRLNPMATLALPSVINEKQYYLFSIYYTPDSNKIFKLMYSTIDMNANLGLGKMIEKEIPIKFGNFTEAITGCKHANSRDWWIIAREYKKKEYSIILLDSSGVHIHSDNQKSGWDLSDVNIVRRNFISKFSWNGKFYASFSHKGLEVFDFNRCTGLLSNRREFPIIGNDSIVNYSICFTKNDKIIYANSIFNIYQINLENNSYQKVANLIPFFDTLSGNPLQISNVFGFSQLTPNDKIYISTTGGSRYLTVIDSPNIIGIGCKVKQHDLKLLTFTNSLPNFPNFELGVDSCFLNSIEESSIDRITVFPNPVKNKLYISGISKIINFEIYNVLGKKVLEGITKEIIDISDLYNGLYIIRINNDIGRKIEVRR